MKHGRLTIAICGLVAGTLAVSVAVQSAAQPAAAGAPVSCSRFPTISRSSFKAGVPELPWRTDFPAVTPPSLHAWQQIDFHTDWQGYMNAVKSELHASGLGLGNRNVVLAPGAEWWIAPWMDYGSNGRESLQGLTKERGPDAGDLSPSSTRGAQVWAIGFYNREGAKALHDVFLDPCNPSRPPAGWTFPDGTVSFKLLFTDASTTEVPWLTGAPEVEAMIDPAGSSSEPHAPGERQRRVLRLLQVDIATRDPQSPFGWVFGTFVWQDRQSDLFGDLVPVGLMWGNDPAAGAEPMGAFATLPSTRLNAALAGILWKGQQAWPGRPWPGFEGRLNGPADNLRSSCLSCHSLAQWPRSRALGILPRPTARYTLQALADPARRAELRTGWMRDVRGGELTDPTEAAPAAGWGGATPLDYSLQLEASFSRLCDACKDGVLMGATPAVCRVAGTRSQVTTPNCPAPGLLEHLFGRRTQRRSEPPRQ